MQTKFTIFTPTFNREHTLQRAYESLAKQHQDVSEWLIIDDGSTDSTCDLVQRLTRESPFRIRYYYQPNGGKHRAHNKAIDLAEGELVIILDSDDALTDNAISLLRDGWERIPKEERSGYAGILGLSMTPDGTDIGFVKHCPYIDGFLFDLYARKEIGGEKLPCYRADVLRKFPFPERKGSNDYVLEGVVWNAISLHYKVRCVDARVRVYHRDKNDSIAIMNKCNTISNPWGKLKYSLVTAKQPRLHFRYPILFLKTIIGISRYAIHSRESMFSALNGVDSWLYRTTAFLLYPVGVSAVIYDRIIDVVRRNATKP